MSGFIGFFRVGFQFQFFFFETTSHSYVSFIVSHSGHMDNHPLTKASVDQSMKNLAYGN